MRTRSFALAGAVLAVLAGLTWLEDSGADPRTELALTPDNGPWMIYVASFRGDDDNPVVELRPGEMARALALYFRSDLRTPAYVYNRSAKLQEEQQQELERLRQRYGEGVPLRRVRIPDEYAVLVGNYKSMEDAGSDLKRIKSLPIPSEYWSSLVIARQERGAYQAQDRSKVHGVVGRPRTLQTAFVTRNPLAPPEPKAEEKFDPAWIDLNAGQKYNLLECRKPWTLVVRVFQGVAMVQGRTKQTVLNTDRSQNDEFTDLRFRLFAKGTKAADLGAAALQAHNLAEILRHKEIGYEAYVFHTQHYSLVTVGGFDRPDHPDLLKTKALLAGAQIGCIRLMDHPMPMKVPRP